MTAVRIVALTLVLVGWSNLADAHEFDPHVVQVSERGEGRYHVRWRAPVETEARLVWPDHCSSTLTRARTLKRWFDARCKAPGLAGETIAVEGLPSPTDHVLLELIAEDGQRWQHVLRGEAATVRIPAAPGAVDRVDVVTSYFVLGIEHLLLGPDHLLFVLGLLGLLRNDNKRLVAAASAFTAGHALTLCLATLDVIRLPPAPVEACIALSLVWLARELVVKEPHALSRRAPALAAGGFGLLHGLGFAGALGALGLPPGQVPWALGAFNVGIEVGQLAVIGVGLAVVGLLGARLQPMSFARTASPLVPHAMGAVASFWVLDRLLTLV